MPWQLLSLRADQAAHDALSDLLFAAGASAVTTLPGGAEEILEPAPGATPLWRSNLLLAQFAEAMDLQPLLALCRRMTAEPVQVTIIEDAEWERICLADWRPLCFAGKLWVVPENAPLPEGEEPRIRLDPGLAFGTGSHPTTALCLEWLANAELAGATLIDYGCGSGILAIAAAKLGAASVHAIDIDPQALRASAENCRKNQLDGQVAIQLAGDLGAALDGKASIVLANIVLGALVELLPRFAALLGPGGRLVVSGLLEKQREVFANRLAAQFELTSVVVKEGWLLMDAIKR